MPKPQPRPPEDFFTAAEIRAALNNAVVASLRPATLGAEIPRTRMYRLSSYVRAFTADVMEHTAEGLLRPEETVLIFASAALYLQTRIRIVRQQEPLMDVSAVATSVLEAFFNPSGKKKLQGKDAEVHEEKRSR